LDPIDHFGVVDPDQVANLFHNQTRYDAAPEFALPFQLLLNLKLDLLGDPLIEPCDEIHGGSHAFVDFGFVKGHLTAPKSPLAIFPRKTLVGLSRIGASLPSRKIGVIRNFRRRVSTFHSTMPKLHSVTGSASMKEMSGSSVRRRFIR
jgi:hypothetical protein